MVPAKVLFTYRQNEMLFVKSRNTEYRLDATLSNFKPIVGDWIEVYPTVPQEENFKNGDYTRHVEHLTTNEIRPLQYETLEGTITKWNNKIGMGIISNQIFFCKRTCNINYNCRIGDKVIANVMKSNQGNMFMRAISLVKLDMEENGKQNKTSNKNGIIFSSSFDFKHMNLGDTKTLQVIVNNNSNVTRYLINVINCHNGKTQQIQPLNIDGKKIAIEPGKSVDLTFTCNANIVGETTESLRFQFDNFNVKKNFYINVKDSKGNHTCVVNEIRENEERMCLCKPSDLKCGFYENNVAKKYVTTLIKADKKLLSNDDACFLEKLFIPINSINLETKLHSLLYIEEMQHIENLRKCNMKTTLIKRNQYLCFRANKKLPISVGSHVIVKCISPNGCVPENGVIDKIFQQEYYLKFKTNFQNQYNDETVIVEFLFSGTLFENSHIAIDLALKNLGKQIIFPEEKITMRNQLKVKQNDENSEEQLTSNNYIEKRSTNLELDESREIKWLNENLNVIQKRAIFNVLSGFTKPMPYIIFGPPGTGKTVTLVEMVAQIINFFPNSKILIATPSNNAADLIARRLIKYGQFQPEVLIRLVSNTHASTGKLPGCLKSYSATLKLPPTTSDDDFPTCSKELQEKCLNCIALHRICICTIGRLGLLLGNGLKFTSIVIDEAGQVTEPETMIPLGFIDKFHGQIILAGDPMQLGPVIFSQEAKNMGLGISFLERLLTCGPYKKDIIGRECENGGYDPQLVTMLKFNYRSFQSIVNFSSDNFYDSGIISKLDIDSKEVQQDKCKLSKIFGMDDDKYTSMIFHGVRGVNEKNTNNPSPFNKEEASLVLSHVHKLYGGNYVAEDIGIITPYVEQVKHIRHLIHTAKINCPQIGTVEEFQGQEKKIIILSLVKSDESIISDKALGFLKESKRMNVALTRAQYLLIIFGNPHVLCRNRLWHNLIKYIISNHGYVGCELPSTLI